jgi:hypothetical protein
MVFRVTARGLEFESMQPLKRYIFIITRHPGMPNDLESLIAAVEAKGVQVDRGYGAVPIDRIKSRFSIRGTADADVLDKISRDSSIEIFTDPGVGEM